MNNITTTPKPDCDLCGAPGKLVQENVPDPDDMIPGKWDIRQCSNPDCGLLWLDPAPIEQDMWKAYTRYHTHTREKSRWPEKALLSLFNRLAKFVLWPIWVISGLRQEMHMLRYMTLTHKSTGRLLDVGCGAGRFLNRMQKLSWEVEGVEFDPQAAKKVIRRYGIPVHVGNLSTCSLSANTYDAVTMNQVIEHLYDLRPTLLECLRILKPRGKLIITTPNVNSMCAAEFRNYWRGWEPPRHLHLFSVEALQRLVQQSGFEVECVRTCSCDTAGIYRVSKVNQLKASGFRIGFLYRLWLLGWGYYRELHEFNSQQATPNTGQNILVCARKPI